MQTTVKRWFKDKHFGFLDNGAGPDVFVPQAELQNCRFLKPGVTVEFECHLSERGLVAKNVRLVQEKRHHHTGPGRRGGQPFIGVMT